MPKPYVFQSRAELVQRLGDARTHAAARAFFEQPSPTINDVVRTGVSGNTFRAFQKLPVRPSETFRTWANGYLQATFTALSTISAPDSYAQYVDDATNDLCEGWRRLTGSEMGYGRGAKLFNLVLKKLACLSCLPAERRTALIRLQHVPLDSYTILGLRSMAPELSIPKSATMKFISDRDQYNRFQSVILEVAQQAGVPPIYYDLLAWDMSH